jgi:hypothetical protein
MSQPKYIITFGTSRRVFYTDYHMEQFCRALDLNGTSYTMSNPNVQTLWYPHIKAALDAVDPFVGSLPCFHVLHDWFTGVTRWRRGDVGK